MVFGDSHLRRMGEFQDILDRKIHHTGATVEFKYRGGARLSFAEKNLHLARGFDLLIIMIGGNDLSLGARQEYFEVCHNRIRDQAKELNIGALIFMSIWPRQNLGYNVALRLLDEKLSADSHRSYGSYWRWDRRLPLATYDTVHLYKKGYKKAITYLAAPILWWLRRRTRRQAPESRR